MCGASTEGRGVGHGSPIAVKQGRQGDVGRRGRVVVDVRARSVDVLAFAAYPLVVVSEGDEVQAVVDVHVTRPRCHAHREVDG